MESYSFKRFLVKIKRVTRKLKKLDWNNPKVLVAAFGIIVFPFVAHYYAMTGILVGTLLALSVLWLLEKSPETIRSIVKKYPLMADIILSTLAVLLLGGYFGSGLTLGIGAIICGLILSACLPNIPIKIKKAYSR
jgi:hypothetical protein